MLCPLKFTQLLHGPMAMTTSLVLGLFSDVLKILGNKKKHFLQQSSLAAVSLT